MTAREESRKSFNKMISGAFRASTMTEISDGIDLTSFTRAIYRQLFGSGTYIWVNGKTLIKTIEDASTGGLKAINIDKKQIEIIYQKVEDFATDPNLGLTVTQIMDEIIKTIINLQISTKQIIIRIFNEETKKYLARLKKKELVKASTLEKIISRIRNSLNYIKQIKKDSKFKKISDFKDSVQKFAGVGVLSTIPYIATSFIGARKVFGKIPLILGPVPIKHADYVEVARSGKVLKFRATGSVFLASQPGGEDAIKIEGTLYKAEFGFLFLLWGLFIYGQSKFKNLEELVSGQGNITDVNKLRKMNDLLMVNSSLQRPSYEYHRTFPFVSKHFIIPNCFIETIVLENKLPVKDVIRYSILLRTYTRPTEAVRFVRNNEKNMSNFGFGKETLTSQICKYSLTTSWRILQSSGWLFDEMEWRIGSASKTGVMDTYYDIDASAVASVAYLNLMGFRV